MSGSDAARFFLALSDPTRLALLDALRDGERPVGELVDALGCPQPKVSRHLKVLKEAGIVRDRRDGRNVLYALSTPRGWPAEARAWIERLDAGLLPQAMTAEGTRRRAARASRPEGPGRAAGSSGGGAAPPDRAAEPAERSAPVPPADMEDFLL